MNAVNERLVPFHLSRLRALDTWQKALENRPLRKDCPDAYHEELMRLADEMDRLGLVDWTEWRDLRQAADQAYLRGVAGEDYQR